MSNRPKRTLRTMVPTATNEPENVEDIVTNCVERMITGLEATEFYNRTVREIYLAQRKKIDKTVAQVLAESDWFANAQQSRVAHPILSLSKRAAKVREEVEDEENGEETDDDGTPEVVEKKQKRDNKEETKSRPSSSTTKKGATPKKTAQVKEEIKEEEEEDVQITEETAPVKEKEDVPIKEEEEEDIAIKETSIPIEEEYAPIKEECHPIRKEVKEEELDDDSNYIREEDRLVNEEVETKQLSTAPPVIHKPLSPNPDDELGTIPELHREIKLEEMEEEEENKTENIE